mmetsp:Transcript_16177/g.44787  ORF Transcript_16177/g.44787 Transcript_16177/m.44787 type:complete len:476 (-) Transcript_16177:194-1621(-)|eukprot:CAMPEP_0172368448 /NCGR_PEP_ID=MMETSP1060-20121228/27245_1 /TAXON_ID=37318 /ORGANISM="Pseudo-nitzschia pungens, Strain cf. cingulata" /LENGTH=475 /DNA_ID=CAMNT_0013093045 /DNA_START=30 /DNA_END=1457 /DNA_ORIENTATION=-
MRFYTSTVALFLVLAASSADALLTPTRQSIPSASSPSTLIAKTPASTTRLGNDAANAAADIPRGGASGMDQGGGTATIPTEVFNLIKSIVGAGVLSLPAGVVAFGNAPSAMIPAVGLITVMGIISAYTFALIGRVCQKTNTMSYADAWDATVGKSTSWIIAMSCFVDCWFGNLSFSMILADTISNLLASVGIAATRTQSLLGVTGLVLLPLCFMKNLASLAPFSLIGIVGMLYTTIAMAIRYFGGAYAPGGQFLATALTAPVFGNAGAAAAMSAKTLILASMLSNAYIAHFSAPKYLAELKNNTIGRFTQVIAWSFGTSVALYCIITALGFLTFGASSNGLILNNYSTQDLLMSFSRVAVGLSVTGSYPLLFDGTREGLMDLLKIPREKRSNSLINKLTLGVLAATTLVAAKLTDLGLVASVGGATFGTALVFIYPTIMFIKSQNGKTTKETNLAKAIAVLGVIMGALGTKLALN